MMFNKKNKDRQEEFFTDYSCISKKTKRAKFSPGKIALSLSYENIIILAIGLIMVLIVCYTFGVEKGKYLTRPSSEDVNARIQETEAKSEKEKAERPAAQETPQPVRLKRKVKIAVSKPFYTIQVATFSKSSSVEKEMQRLKSKGYDSFIVTKGKYTEICIGKYTNKNQASADLKELKSLYGDCFVRKQ